MGLDGFSMGNLGLNIDLTSAQMANQAEQLAQKGLEPKVQNIIEASKENGIKSNEEKPDGKNQFQDGFREKKKDDNPEEQKLIVEKSFDNKNSKEFSIRINSETGFIELFNNKDETILEVINAQDLMEVISKMDSASGILVNRKI